MAKSPSPSTSSASSSSGISSCTSSSSLTSISKTKYKPLFYCCLDCGRSFSKMIIFVDHCKSQHATRAAARQQPEEKEKTTAAAKVKGKGRNKKGRWPRRVGRPRRIPFEKNSGVDGEMEESKEGEDGDCSIEQGRNPDEMDEQSNGGDEFNANQPPTPGTAEESFQSDLEKYFSKCVKIGDKELRVNMGCPDGERHLKVRKSDIHGRGLFTGNYIRKDEIIIEYTGELVNEKVALQRQQQYDRQNLDNYIMKFANNIYMDATVTGNCARFINNSCNPNCSTHMLPFGGGWKTFIFALRNILAGEELSYDYRFESDVLVECNCGSINCRTALNWNIKKLKLRKPALRHMYRDA